MINLHYLSFSISLRASFFRFDQASKIESFFFTFFSDQFTLSFSTTNLIMLLLSVKVQLTRQHSADLHCFNYFSLKIVTIYLL